MARNQPQIKFPEKNTQIGFEDEAKKRFDKIDNLLIAVVASVVISGIAVIISVVGLFIDQLRYNNVVYTEYSKKIESFDNFQKVNKSLLEQSAKYQEIIFNQQKKLEELFNK